MSKQYLKIDEIEKEYTSKEYYLFMSLIYAFASLYLFDTLSGNAATTSKVLVTPLFHVSTTVSEDGRPICEKW